jgi:hypothetical protein
MKLIDAKTGESPVIRSGDQFSWTVTVTQTAEGDIVEVPDGLTTEAEEATFVTVKPAAS